MTTTYNDNDLVYVDPDARQVVGKVEFDKSGKPKALERPPRKEKKEDADQEKKPKKRKKQYYPWGTYKTVKKIYKVEGKIREEKEMITLDTAIEKCLQEPYWD